MTTERGAESIRQTHVIAAQLVGLPRRVTSNLVDTLERQGWLVIERGDRLKQERNCYRLADVQPVERAAA